MKNKKLLFLVIFFIISGLRASENKADPQGQEEAKPVAKIGRALIEIGIEITIASINYWHQIYQVH